jgi:2,5-diketo-D-gluconate reductase A
MKAINSKLKLNSGNTIPVMGLGTWKLLNNTANTVLYAIQQGYKLIDTSSDYGTQPAIGEAIKKTGVSRDELYIITKVEETDNAYQASQKYIEEMNLEYANLILIHRPPLTGAGIDLWKRLIKAKNDGFTHDIGVSNYSARQIDQLIYETGEVPVVNQIEWSLFGHSQKMLEYCQDKNIVIQAYSPLTRAKRLDEKNLKQIALKYNKSPAQILIRWNLQQGTIPIPKANQKTHLEENLNVFDFEINQKDIETLNGLNEHYSSLGFLPYL